MADKAHLAILLQGNDTWAQWRKEHSDTRPDLRGATLRGAGLGGVNLSGTALGQADLSQAALSQADLSQADLRETDLRQADLREANLRGADLIGADLRGTDLRRANLRGTDLRRANLRRANLSEGDFSGVDLSGANLRGAGLGGANLSEADLCGTDLGLADLSGAHLGGTYLREADLREANLRGADLREADLREADLRGADLRGADLRGADLERALLVETNLETANLANCYIYGISAWELRLEGAIQTNLVITPRNQPTISVDNLEVAQFIYLLLNNKKLRDVIDTMTSKVVLILGRFTPERETIVDALRDTLRKRNYLPVLFDFDHRAGSNVTETISTLAHLARFIVADITDPTSIPQELQAIIAAVAVPVQPIIERPNLPWGMFEDFPKKYDWVLATHEYKDSDDLLAALGKNLIAPAEAKAKDLAAR